MKCLSPVTIRNPVTGQYIAVPCGKCVACLQTKRADWSFRLSEHLKDAFSALFVTFTYTDENLPFNPHGLPCFSKRDCQLFFKNLRQKTSEKISYYLTSEYGEHTHRPHYHAILFNVHRNLDQAKILVEETWTKGYVSIGTVTPASIHYVTKYQINRFEKNFQDDEAFTEECKPFSLCSKKLGYGYIERSRSYHEGWERFYVAQDQFKLHMPRYISERVYSQAEREEHAIKSFKLPSNDEENGLLQSTRLRHLEKSIKDKSKSKTY